MLQSCIPSFEATPEDRLYIKEINQRKIHLSWFFYSTVSTVTPDYITIQKEGRTDTICIASNVADLKFDGHKIVIEFYGAPNRYAKTIKLPETTIGYPVIVDTTEVFSDLTAKRFTYRRMGTSRVIR